MGRIKIRLSCEGATRNKIYLFERIVIATKLWNQIFFGTWNITLKTGTETFFGMVPLPLSTFQFASDVHTSSNEPQDHLLISNDQCHMKILFKDIGGEATDAWAYTLTCNILCEILFLFHVPKYPMERKLLLVVNI